MSVDHCPTCHRPARRSFLYPPYLGDADSVISYYEDIEIDDATVSKFIDAYGAARANWAEQHMDSFDVENHQKHGGNQEKLSEARWAEFRRVEQMHPTHANPIFARDITRAVQMARIADWSLDSDEKAKLLAHEITMANGDTQPVGYIADRYLVGQYEADLI